MKKILSLVLVCLLVISIGYLIMKKAAPSWPVSTVTIYVPARAGGGTDIFARILATALKEETGKTFVVVNQPSEGGVVAYESCRTAAPNGNSLMLWYPGFFVNYYTGTYRL